MTETDIQRDITKHLEALGYLVLRLNAGGYRNRVQMLPPGTPDLLVLGDKGMALWLEVKTDTGKVRPDQQAWHDRMRARGHRVEVVRSVEDVQEVLS